MRCLILAAALAAAIPAIPAQAGNIPVRGLFSGGNISVTQQSGSNNSASVNVIGSHNLTSITQVGQGQSFNRDITGTNQSLSVIQMNSQDYSGTWSSTSSTPNNGSATYIIQITPRSHD